MPTNSRDSTTHSRPLSIQQIVEKAENFDYNPLIPLKYWLRTAGTLLKEADIYDHEGNDQQTYFLLFRHAQLVIGRLSNHPDASLPESKLALVQAGKEVQKSLERMEMLKPRIKKKYERFEQLMNGRRQRDERSGRKRAPVDGVDGMYNDVHSNLLALDPALAGRAETLVARDHQDLAVLLAHREIRRRATVRMATNQTSTSTEAEQRSMGSGKDDERDEVDLGRRMQQIRRQINSREESSAALQPPSLKYPSINHKQGWSPPSPPPLPQVSLDLDEAPALPPKAPFSDPPARPSKFHIPQPPRPRQDPKPTDFAFKPSAYLENGSPLRTLFLSPELRHRFLAVAAPNTRANLETCGILCGTLISNALFISKLVIPEQESTSDTCDTVNESALFDYVDGEDLMVLGWIHTHPTQTCFMSSRDLHTHSGYQVMMSESIAIVCAPSRNDWGVFRLTDPPGMQTILNCSQTGLFHPHAENDVYTEALRPGHVFEAQGLEFEVVDLR